MEGENANEGERKEKWGVERNELREFVRRQEEEERKEEEGR